MNLPKMRVKVLVLPGEQPGERLVAGGVYFSRLQMEGFQEVKKMLLVR